MLTKYFDRIETLDRLITIKGTGTPQQLANRLDISESSLYQYLAFMKRMGAPIAYCKYRCSYYYTDNGNFTIKFLNKKTDADVTGSMG